MSAETIPADVLYLIRKGGLFYRPNSQGYTAHTFDAGRYTLAEAEAITHPNGPDGPRDGLSYVPAPADRSTRPAEPAAPVAEAGDGDVAASLAHLNIGYLYGIADALEHTDFNRAGDIRQCLLQVVKGLSASAATLEAERARADELCQERDQALIQIKANIAAIDRAKEFVRVAEQRAADALARAEKGAEDWQPIEKAPRDGTPFLGWDGYSMWPCAKVEDGPVTAIGQRVIGIMCGSDVRLWRPLPAPPRNLSQGGQHG